MTENKDWSDVNPDDLKMGEIIRAQRELAETHGDVSNWPEQWRKHNEKMSEWLKPLRDSFYGAGKFARDLGKTIPNVPNANIPKPYLVDPKTFEISNPEVDLLKDILAEIKETNRLLRGES